MNLSDSSFSLPYVFTTLIPEMTSWSSLATSSFFLYWRRKIRLMVFLNVIISVETNGTRMKVSRASLMFSTIINTTSQMKMKSIANRLQNTSAMKSLMNLVSCVILLRSSPGLLSPIKLSGSFWYFSKSCFLKSAAILEPSLAEALLFMMFSMTIDTLKVNISASKAYAVLRLPFPLSTSLIRCFCTSGLSRVVTATITMMRKTPRKSFEYGPAIFRNMLKKPPSPEHLGQRFVPGIALPQMGQVFSYSLLITSSNLPEIRMLIPRAIYEYLPRCFEE